MPTLPPLGPIISPNNSRRPPAAVHRTTPLARQPSLSRRDADADPGPNRGHENRTSREAAPPPAQQAPSARGEDEAKQGSASRAGGRPSPVSQQARLLAQPLPDMPDDLREESYQAVAFARFIVHVDGTFDIELIKPTPNPRLNQILLATLRQWRFFPAMETVAPWKAIRTFAFTST